MAKRTCFNKTGLPCWDAIEKAGPDSFVDVWSAFNGLAIYKASAVGDCQYTEHNPYNNEGDDCEHVAFHGCMREHGSRVRVMGSKVLGRMGPLEFSLPEYLAQEQQEKQNQKHRERPPEDPVWTEEDGWGEGTRVARVC